MSSVALEREASPGSVKIRTKAGLRQVALSALALAAVLGGGWWGHHWWTVGRYVESTDDAYVGGNVTAISPHVAGFVSQIVVHDNQHVDAGQLILRLDPRPFEAALDHSAAVVRGREATLASLRAKLVLQQSAIRQAEADLSARTAQAAFAREDAARYRSLALTRAGSQQSAQKAAAADQEAAAAVAASRAGLAAARQQLAVLDTEIAEAEASVSEARADLETARLDLGYTEIRSPVAGYVGNRAARVGAYASTGAYLLSIIPANGLWIDANFKEDQLARMVPGQPATIHADAVPGREFHGRVASLAPGTGAVFSIIPPENATGNFTKIVQRVPVRIRLDAGDAALGSLRPGLSATVAVDTRAGAKGGP
jgi:membrane fusion protein (multidrug efflux system)